MKNDKKNLVQQTIFTTAALFALLGLPNLLHAQGANTREVPSKASSSRKTDYFLKINTENLAQQKMSLVAVMKGEPVFRNGKGNLFKLNSNTGDIIAVSKEEFAKLACCGAKAGGSSSGYIIKEATAKNSGKPFNSNIFLKVEKAVPNIKVLGVDKDGHIIQETEKGEKFFLDPATGDMIDYNGHVAKYKQ